MTSASQLRLLLGHSAFGGCVPIPDELEARSAPFEGDDAERERLVNLYGHADSYDWCTENWGCTRDVDLNQADGDPFDGIYVFTADTVGFIDGGGGPEARSGRQQLETLCFVFLQGPGGCTVCVAQARY
jgi:hypothetical protein